MTTMREIRAQTQPLPTREALRIDRELRGRRPFLLLGEAPNHAAASRPEVWLMPDDSMTTHAANRLLWLSGLTHRRFLELFDRDNLVRTPRPLTASRYRAHGRARVGEILQRVDALDQRLIVLGALPASCFTWVQVEDLEGWRVPQVRRGQEIETCRWLNVFQASAAIVTASTQAQVAIPGPQAQACLLPHPSGRNRALNQPENQERLRAWFDALARTAP